MYCQKVKKRLFILITSIKYKSMIQFEENIIREDEQVLSASGFFKYHNLKFSPPEVYNSEDNKTYLFSTINVEAISFIIK